MQSCVVVGAGISGLSAAWELVNRHPSMQVTVLEASDRVGGKLRGADVAGVRVDVGAESVLARRPEAVDLIRDVGLGDDLVHPATSTASIWSRGQLHPMPPRTLMGIPSDVESLRGLLTEEEVTRAGAERVGVAADADVSIGDLVADRLGPAVLDRLVEPLLGGVYAGHAREISAAAALPVAWEAYRSGSSLTATAAAALPTRADEGPPAPVFAGLRGGLHRLPTRLAEALTERGARVVTGVMVRGLHLSDAGFELVTGPVPRPTTYSADLVVLALPPAPSARLLAQVAPGAAQLVARVETASMALVTIALRAERMPELVGSGFLVPPVEGRAVKAATFSATKWDWVRAAGRGAGPDGGDLVLLRASLGRHREEAVLQHADAELVALALREVGEIVGAPLPPPVDTHVQRWGGGLPQYAVGHRQRMTAVREQVAAVPGLAVCGATYDGVGIPACIASGRAAAHAVAATPPPRCDPGHAATMSTMAPSSAQHPQPSPEQVDQINTGIRYAMYSVFRVSSPLEGDRQQLASEVDALLADVTDAGVQVRGLYDIAGLRADADLMVWWHAAEVELVQTAYQRLRRTGLGRHLEPVWSQVAMHRPAEFNRGHVPAFLAGEEPRAYLCVYPFVRSYEWYVMDEGERRAMLKEHGLAARDYPDVRANTLSSFALGDYEWILAFEADELHRIVDLMRELRNTRARLHVREEVPFYTGPRVSAAQFVASAP